MYKELYERIALQSKKKGWSIYKVEREADIGNGIIGKLRSGRGLTVQTVVKIAKALDVSVDYLLGITEE